MTGVLIIMTKSSITAKRFKLDNNGFNFFEAFIILKTFIMNYFFYISQGHICSRFHYFLRIYFQIWETNLYLLMAENMSQNLFI